MRTCSILEVDTGLRERTVIGIDLAPSVILAIGRFGRSSYGRPFVKLDAAGSQETLTYQSVVPFGSK